MKRTISVDLQLQLDQTRIHLQDAMNKGYVPKTTEVTTTTIYSSGCMLNMIYHSFLEVTRNS